MILKILLCFTLLTVLVLHGSSLNAGLKSEPEELLVSAAISLKEAFEELARIFETQQRVKVHFNFAASGILQNQIEYGAPVDVYASAGKKQMDILERKALILEGTRRDFAKNIMIFIKPKYFKIPLNSIYDLEKPEIKTIAIGHPKTVPAGYYAKAILEGLGLWSNIRPKLIYAQNVQNILVYIQRGEADAGLVYKSDLQKKGTNSVESIHIPLDSQPSIVYPIAVIRNSPHRDMATKFVEHITSVVGQRILKEHGFDIP